MVKNLKFQIKGLKLGKLVARPMTLGGRIMHNFIFKFELK